MKRKERYKVLNYAKKQYGEEFALDLQFKHLSKRELYALLKKYTHSFMFERSYCCRGLYQCCWQECIGEGNWGLTQEDVNEDIKRVIDETVKACRKDSRILYRKSLNGREIDAIIVMRDVCAMDWLITFTSVEY